MIEITRILIEFEKSCVHDIELVWYSDGSGMIRQFNGAKSLFTFESEEELLKFLIKQTT